MHTSSKVPPDVVPLKQAVLCVNCESVSSGRASLCPVCGSQSLFSIAPVLGGSLLPVEDERSFPRSTAVSGERFELEFTVTLKQVQAQGLNLMVEGLTELIRNRLGREQAEFHVNVRPMTALRLEVSERGRGKFESGDSAREDTGAKAA